jgi:hypothetical protein
MIAYDSHCGCHADYEYGRIASKRLSLVCDIEQLPRFVETGTYLGSGVEWALGRSFREILSCEYSSTLYQSTSAKLGDRDRVRLSCGDSVQWLKTIDLTVPTFYYLDAHDSGGSTEYVPGLPIPVAAEMMALVTGRLGKSVIAIDDERLLPENLIVEVIGMARANSMSVHYVDDTIVLVGDQHRWDA